ncbi:MAG: hypothetical protein ACK5YO_02285, partial [Planctomyces sp.]
MKSFRRWFRGDFYATTGGPDSDAAIIGSSNDGHRKGQWNIAGRGHFSSIDVAQDTNTDIN